MKITSVNNELIKETAKLLQRKYRDEKGLFLLEGEKCIQEALASGLEIVHIFEIEGCKSFSNSIDVTEPVMSKIEWNDDYKHVVLLENIKDAGNLGTILRTAAAFNVDAVVLYGDTVDLYNPKCVRSSVGNLWKIPVFHFADKTDLMVNFMGYERVATLPKSNNSVWLKDYTPTEKVLVMFGTEAAGLSNELKEFANKNVTIEMSKEVESLNLSISAGVILYKLFTTRA